MVLTFNPLWGNMMFLQILGLRLAFLANLSPVSAEPKLNSTTCPPDVMHDVKQNLDIQNQNYRSFLDRNPMLQESFVREMLELYQELNSLILLNKEHALKSEMQIEKESVKKMQLIEELFLYQYSRLAFHENIAGLLAAVDIEMVLDQHHAIPVLYFSLKKAMQKFDLTRTALNKNTGEVRHIKFVTFFTTVLQRDLIHLIPKTSEAPKLIYFEDLSTPFAPEANANEKNLERYENLLQHLETILEPRLFDMFVKREIEDQTLEEIAAPYRLTKERIRQLVVKAKATIQKTLTLKP